MIFHTKRAIAIVRPVNIQMTARKAISRCSAVIGAIARSGNKDANIHTEIDAIAAASKPRPPSRKPYALPCPDNCPHSRVERIIAAQKSSMVVIPHTDHSTFITFTEGMPARTMPPIPVALRAAAMSLRAEKRSASGPPAK